MIRKLLRTMKMFSFCTQLTKVISCLSDSLSQALRQKCTAASWVCLVWQGTFPWDPSQVFQEGRRVGWPLLSWVWQSELVMCGYKSHRIKCSWLCFFFCKTFVDCTRLLIYFLDEGYLEPSNTNYLNKLMIDSTKNVRFLIYVEFSKFWNFLCEFAFRN